MPSPSAPDGQALDALIERAKLADGQPPFSDQALVDLRSGERDSLWIEDSVAILSPVEAEFVVDPAFRGHGLGTRMLETVIARSGPELRIWAHGDHPAARALAASHGLVPARELLQLRRVLAAPLVEIVEAGKEPADETSPASTSDEGSRHGRERPTRPAEVLDQRSRHGRERPTRPAELADERSRHGRERPTRPAEVDRFRPGIDDSPWLALNSRAFAFHPEQGSVSQSDLDALTAEPWFDAGDFLVLRDGDTMVGYCWLKIEHDLGEFYVVGVDPDRQGEGLGRLLMDAGFARLAARGIRTAALYVEADNAPAVSLYRSLGFEDHSIDIQYAFAV